MAKTGLAGIAAGRTDIFRMCPSKIKIVEGWNSRDFDHPDNIAHVDALAASIVEVGVKEPLAGYLEDGAFVLTNGESRLRAVRKLIEMGYAIETVPVIPEPRNASDADHLASQFIRNSGRPFTPMENCELFTRLKALGLAEKDIAVKTGLTVERVQQIAKLGNLPKEVKKSVRKGEVSATVVQRLQSKGKSPQEIKMLVETAVKTAKADGKTKASPRHMKGPRTERMADTMKKNLPNYEKLFMDLVAHVTAIESEASDKTEEVTISIPKSKWKIIETAYKKGKQNAH